MAGGGAQAPCEGPCPRATDRAQVLFPSVMSRCPSAKTLAQPWHQGLWHKPSWVHTAQGRPRCRQRDALPWDAGGSHCRAPQVLSRPAGAVNTGGSQAGLPLCLVHAPKQQPPWGPSRVPGTRHCWDRPTLRDGRANPAGQHNDTVVFSRPEDQRDSHFPPEHSPCSACLRETWLLRPGMRPGAWGASCHPPQRLATTGPVRPSKVQVLAGGTVPGKVTYRGPQQRPPPSFSSLPLGDGPEKILKESPLYPHFPNW